MPSFQTIVNSIMSKIPVRRLRHLRADLEAEAGGLSLEEFVRVAIRNMELADEAQLLATVPELVDLFGVIDVNGDGCMEWSEFVSFLIEQVLQLGRAASSTERIVGVSADAIKDVRQDDVQAVQVFIGKLFVACGRAVHVYSLDPQSATWMAQDCARIRIADEEEDEARAMDLAFLDAEDLLLVLRSDRSVRCVRLTTRANLTSDSVFFMGALALPMHCSRILLRQLPGEPTLLLAVGASSRVMVWTIVTSSNGRVALEDARMLAEEHTDLVRDLLAITEGPHPLLVSGGVDRRCVIYDLLSLRVRSVRTSPTNGVRCLAHNQRLLLLAGCIDHSVVAWDLESDLDMPLFTLRGHGGCVVKVLAFGDRCFSLDLNGELRYWDLGEGGGDGRCVDCKRPVDRLHSFAAFTHASSLFDTLDNVVVAACGRLTHVFRLQCVSAAVEPPLAVLVAVELLTIVTVHASDLLLWNAVSGEQTLRIDVQRILNAEVTCAALNYRGHKILCGDASGVLSSFNCFNGAYLGSVVAGPASPVRAVFPAPDRMVFLLLGQCDLVAVDDADCFAAGVIRVNHVRDRFAVAAAYSPALGVIAVADSCDNLMLFDATFLSLELTVPGCTGSEVGNIEFVESFPLLLVCSNDGKFVLVPIFLHKTRIPVWRVSVVLDDAPDAGFTLEQRIKYMSGKHVVRSVNVSVARKDDVVPDVSVYGQVLRRSFLDTWQTVKAAAHAPDASFRVDVTLGYEDGVMAALSLDYAIESTNVSRVADKDWPTQQPGFDNRRHAVRDTTEFSLERTALLRATARRSERKTRCTLLHMWKAHSGSVASVHYFRNTSCILSASEDRHVSLWSSAGSLMGELTRGTKADMVRASRWQSPVDMEYRRQEMRTLAELLRDCLQLKVVSFHEDVGHDAPHPVSLQFDYNTSLAATSLKSSRFKESFLSGSYCQVCELPGHIRALGQLSGAITYTQSIQELHRSVVGPPSKQLRDSLERLQIEHAAKAPRRTRRRKGKAEKSLVFVSEDAEYMESIVQQTCIKTDDDMHCSLPKTKFDDEIQRFDAADPSSWDIASNNRQSQMYRNLHRELTVKGLLKDPISSLELKLDILSPGGNFLEYVFAMREKYGNNGNVGNKARKQGASPVRVGSSVPPLLFDSTATSLTASLKKSKTPISLAVSRISKTRKLEPLYKSVSAFELPVAMSKGLNSDMSEKFTKNHGETASAYAAFIASVKSAERKYSRARKEHRKAMKIQSKSVRTLPKVVAQV